MNRRSGYEDLLIRIFSRKFLIRKLGIIVRAGGHLQSGKGLPHGLDPPASDAAGPAAEAAPVHRPARGGDEAARASHTRRQEGRAPTRCGGRLAGWTSRPASERTVSRIVADRAGRRPSPWNARRGAAGPSRRARSRRRRRGALNQEPGRASRHGWFDDRIGRCRSPRAVSPRLSPRAGMWAWSGREPSRERDVAAEVAALADLDVHELRVRWRKLFRKQAPAHLPRALLCASWPTASRRMPSATSTERRYVSSTASHASAGQATRAPSRP